MKSYKTGVRIIAIFSVCYILLLIPQTGFQSRYDKFLCNIGNVFFHEFGKEGIVQMSPQKGKDDISLLLSKTSLVVSGTITSGQKFDKSSDLIGFFYTAFLIALIIATPVGWKRKSIALFFGFVLITLFALIKLRIIILNCYVITPSLGLYQDAAEKESISFWYRKISAQMPLGYSLVIILWLGLCMGKKEWQKLNGVLFEKAVNNKTVKQNIVSDKRKQTLHKKK
jgi:hypothetical protein